MTSHIEDPLFVVTGQIDIKIIFEVFDISYMSQLRYLTTLRNLPGQPSEIEFRQTPNEKWPSLTDTHGIKIKQGHDKNHEYKK